MLEDIEDQNESEEAFKYRMSIAKDLYSCASEQGLGEASNELALGLLFHKKYSEALIVLHQGVINGNDSSAHRLDKGFSGQYKDGDMYFFECA